MSEETTENLGADEPSEALVLAELKSVNSRLTSMEGRLAAAEDRLSSLEGRVGLIDGRLTSLEEKVDARLHDTRPIWEAVLARHKMIDKMMDVFARYIPDLRAEVELPEERLPPPA